MDITPNKLTIGQLFKNSNEQFVIPAYQRRYAWGYDQYAALFDDINMLREDDSHLFGMILLHTDLHKGGLNRPELVDGQQRIATIIILFLAIRNRYKELKKKEKLSQIDNFLYSKDFDEKKQIKLILGDLDNSDFRRILKQKDLDRIKNQKLLNAYYDFNEWMQDFNYSELNRFLYKLENMGLIIRLDVGIAKDAYKLFETINNRGLRLSPTDLIKNFILGHAAKHDEKILEEVKELWAEIITNLDNLDTNTFLRQFTCALLKQKTTMNSLVERFKNYYMNHVTNTDILSDYGYYCGDIEVDEEELEEDADNNKTKEEKKVTNEKDKVSITEFLSKIRDASIVYKKIRTRTFENKKINKSLFNLYRIMSLPSYIFLLDLFQRNLDDKTILKILKLIEIFMLRRHVCQKRTGELDEIFSKLIEIDSNNIVEETKKKLLKDLPKDNEFVESIPKHEFKGKVIDRAKYVLEQLEYYLIKDKGEFELTSGRDLHLEHIIPQTIHTKKSKREYGDWVTYLGDDAIIKHKKYVNKIGNMTLLAEKLNIGAYNNPFSKKKFHYRKSNIKLNKLICNEYKNFKFKHVENRGEEFAKIALKIWSF